MAASACWPPLSGIFGIISVACAIFSQTAQAAVPLGLVFCALGLAWWALIGRSHDLSGPCLMLSGCLGSPLASVPLCGFALPPVSALVTGAAGWAYWRLLSTAERLAFSPDALASELISSLTLPDTWVMLATCGIASLLCAIVSRQKTPLGVSLGQLLSMVILAGVPALLAHMENTSIADALDKPALAVALTLGVTLCLACALVGDEGLNREGDETA